MISPIVAGPTIRCKILMTITIIFQVHENRFVSGGKHFASVADIINNLFLFGMLRF